MPAIEAHLKLANHNQTVLDLLLQTCDLNPDWVVTVAFYKAVHLVEALFKQIEDFDSCDHYERNAKLKKSYPKIWKLYSSLWMASCVARYLECSDGTSCTTFSQYCPTSRVHNLISYNLANIESEVNNQLPKTEEP